MEWSLIIGWSAPAIVCPQEIYFNVLLVPTVKYVQLVVHVLITYWISCFHMEFDIEKSWSSISMFMVSMLVQNGYVACKSFLCHYGKEVETFWTTAPMRETFFSMKDGWAHGARFKYKHTWRMKEPMVRRRRKIWKIGTTTQGHPPSKYQQPRSNTSFQPLWKGAAAAVWRMACGRGSYSHQYTHTDLFYAPQ